MQLIDPLGAPGALAGVVGHIQLADTRPRHLEHRAHGHAHGPAVQRIVTGRAREHGIDPHGRGAAEDGPDVGVVRDVLQHGHESRPFQYVGHARQRGATEGAQGPAGQLEAREARELIARRYEHRQAIGVVEQMREGCPGRALRGKRASGRAGGCICCCAAAFFHLRDERAHSRQPLLLHEQRNRLHAALESPLDYLLRLRDEQCALRLQLAAQLRLGQPCVSVQPRIVERAYIYKGHDGSFQNKSARLL